ncbi:hypothetical protein [Nocardia sp. NPDC050793]|uniref:hypothetical protein n=1 Tax=Nocardia sp. NPDC050793 TaxID=3155159 RepID=UPI0033DEB8EF
MIVTSTISGPAGSAPTRPAGTELWASIDVEWTKNYRVRNGNRPFCYSVVYLAVPTNHDGPVELAGLPWTYTSVYIEDPTEMPALLNAANAAVKTAFTAADRVTGHQFTSDLAVLARASDTDLPAVSNARGAWLARREEAITERQIIDTRYDTDHVLEGHSRRLVDVATEVGLDVTQPELRGTSMTAIHRQWIENQSTEARERVSVLNLRHSLSTALVAQLATGVGRWSAPLNVNRMLAAGLEDAFAWLAHPTFAALLKDTE